MGRRKKRRIIRNSPEATFFKPQGVPLAELRGLALPLEGLEAMRLADGEGVPQEQAAAMMGVSRPTFNRILAHARQTVANALAQGMAIRIDGGDYELLNEAFCPGREGAGPGRGMERGQIDERGRGRGRGRGGGRDGGRGGGRGGLAGGRGRAVRDTEALPPSRERNDEDNRSFRPAREARERPVARGTVPRRSSGRGPMDMRRPDAAYRTLEDTPDPTAADDASHRNEERRNPCESSPVAPEDKATSGSGRKPDRGQGNKPAGDK